MRFRHFSVYWIWIILAGLLIFILGIGTLGLSTDSGLELETTVAIVLLVVGLIEGIIVYNSQKAVLTIAGSVVAILALALGVWLLIDLNEGMLALTTVVALYLLTQGAYHFFWAFETRSESTYHYLLANGVLSLFWAVGIYWHWFGAEAQSIGVILAVNFLITGILLVIIGIIVRNPRGGTPDEHIDVPVPTPEEKNEKTAAQT